LSLTTVLFSMTLCLASKRRPRVKELMMAKQKPGYPVIARKRPKEALREANQTLQALIEASPVAIMVLDLNGRVKMWSPAAERIFGWSEQEVVGAPLPTVSEDQQEELQRNIQAVMRGEDFTGLETQRRRKDGSPVDVSIWTASMRGPAGNVDSIMSIIADISERKRTEKETQQAEEQLRHQLDFTRAVTSSLGEGVCALDRQGRITFVNPAAEQMLGWTEAELLGRDLRQVVYAQPQEGADLPPEADPLQRATLTGESFRSYDQVFRRKEGATFPIAYAVSPIVTDGQVSGAVLAFHDITERKRVEEALAQHAAELARSNADLEQFANVASHDLQEPLRMVASFTRLLATRYKGKLDADADEYISYAVDGAARMHQLINDLLAYSRVSSRGKEFELTDCEAVLSGALANLRTALEESAAVVTYDRLPTVMADRLQLGQLFQNLIGNALKYTHPDRDCRITISAARWDEAWAITVADNGIGIPADQHARIFEPFTQVEQGATRRAGGTGLGLSVTRRLARLHRGGLTVESAPGRGSVFRINLPRESVGRRNAKREDAKRETRNANTRSARRETRYANGLGRH